MTISLLHQVQQGATTAVFQELTERLTEQLKYRIPITHRPLGFPPFSRKELYLLTQAVINHINSLQSPDLIHIATLSALREPNTVPFLLQFIKKSLLKPEINEEILQEAISGVIRFPSKEVLEVLQQLQRHPNLNDVRTFITNKFACNPEIWDNIKHHPVHVTPTPQNCISISQPIYHLQRRPAHPSHLIINDGQKGIHIWDINHRAITQTLQFISEYSNQTYPAIEGWCLREDGNAFLVLQTQSSQANLIEINEPATQVLFELPSLKTKQDIRYIWSKEFFWLRGFWSPVGYHLGLGKLERTLASTMRQSSTNWFDSLRKLHAYFSEILRVECNKHRFLYFDFSNKQDAFVGVYNWETSNNLQVPVSNYISKVAFDGSHLFCGYLDQVVSLSPTGEIMQYYDIPKGYICQQIDVAYIEQNQQPMLIIGCESIDENMNEQGLLVLHEIKHNTK